MHQRVTSRLVERQRKKMVKQTIMIALVALVVLLLFLFLVLPSFIRIINAVFGTNVPQMNQDDIPPQPPVISAPVSATFSAQIQINGFAEPKSKLTLLVNAQKQEGEIEIGEDGSFSIDADLTEGENILALFAVDGAGNESALSKEYRVIYDRQTPELTIENPADNLNIVGKENQNLNIQGKTEPGSKLYVNEKLIFPNTEGIFSYTFRLQEGSNPIKFVAVDKAGNQIEQEITVNFTP